MMIVINDHSLQIKNYFCAGDDNQYLSKQDNRLWLYVNITDYCPGICAFCVNRCSMKKVEENSFDIDLFSRVFMEVLPWIDGVSITGGEPMADIDLLSEATRLIRAFLPEKYQMDLVTSGYQFHRIPMVKGIEFFSGIHLSRHRISDEDNRRVIGDFAPSMEEVARVIEKLPDRGAVTFNCVLSDDGISSQTAVSDYLETAASAGVENVSFIGMFPANAYCREHYISPIELKLEEDPRYRIWNHFQDHDYCSCSSGDYLSRNGWIRYYYRCPGSVSRRDYCRQLVYTADNHLRAGFGNSEILI